jgi:hypothetical protein
MPLDLIHLPLAVVLILVILGILYYLRIMNAPYGKHAVNDITDPMQPLPLDNAIEAEIRLLARLGFQPLGILEYRFFWRPEPPAPLWHYVDAARTTGAEISTHPFDPSRSLVRLFSWFPDHALVETYFDYGETIDEADYNVRFAKRDLEQAYSSHRQRLGSFTARHGTPVVIQDAKQLIPYSDVDIERYRRRRMCRTSRIALMLLGSAVLGLIVIGMSAFADRGVPGMTGLLILAVGLPVCFLMMVLTLLRFRYPVGALDA